MVCYRCGEILGQYLQTLFTGMNLISEKIFIGCIEDTPRFSYARKLPQIQTKRPNLSVFCLKDANGIANSEDPDQTAPVRAV